MKKGIILFLAMMILLVGCSTANDGNNQVNQPNSPSSSSNEVIHLKMWGGVPPENGPQQAVDNWNAANPDIQVEYLRYVNDDTGNTKLDTAILAGGQVDIFINYGMSAMMRRINAGLAEPLDDFVNKDQFDIVDNFGENAVLEIDGKTYYIPAIILNEFVTLNKDLLDELNLPVPESWTFDEYMEYAIKLTSGEGADKRFGSFIGCLEPKVEWMDSIVKTELGPDPYYKDDGTSNFDAPAFEKYIEIMVDMERNLKVQPPFSEAITSKMQGNSLFITEKAAMNLCGTASLRIIKDTENYPHDFITALAPTPKIFEDSKHLGGGTTYFDFVSISSDSKYKEAAWKFVKWYVTEGNEPLIAGGRVPAWKKADTDKVLELLLGENPEQLFDVESLKRVIFSDNDYLVDSKVDKLPEITKVVNEQIEKTLLGEQTPAEAVTVMKEHSDKILLED